MDLLTALQRSGGVVALARQLQIEPPAATAPVASLLPILVTAFRELHDSAGASALLALFAQQGGVALAAEIMAVDRADPLKGRVILARVGIDAGAVAASCRDEVDPALALRMLPLLAMLVGGYLSGIELAREDSYAALARLLESGEPDAAMPDGS